MKKVLIAVLGLILLISLAACGNQADNSQENTDTCVAYGKILSVTDNDRSLLLEATEDSGGLIAGTQFVVAMENMPASPEPRTGDTVKITFDGSIEETYPARLCNVSSIEVIDRAVTENAVIRATLAEIDMDNDLIKVFSDDGSETTYIIYNWSDCIPEGIVFYPGDMIKITYNGMATEEDPAALCGVTNIEMIYAEDEGNPNAAVCIDGTMYYDTGKAVPVEPEESSIEYTEIPISEGHNLVGTISAFARLEEGKLLVCKIGNEWYEFTAE